MSRTVTLLRFTVDGRAVEVADDGASLLEVLRDRLALRTAKDGCSPQGQCGCCTVLVDGAPRVSCVTPVRRLSGREVTTLDGLPDDVRRAWGDSFCATGGSQCGFCTPGIVLRLEGLRRRGVAADDRVALDRGLKAHLCRCTGWQTIREAYAGYGTIPAGDRDLEVAARRAALEGRTAQVVNSDAALGHGRFADDRAPADALVAVLDGAGDWVVAETLTEARHRAGKIQGRRTTVQGRPPLELPPGEWVRTLRTRWVEPAYLETDASWCEPGREPASPVANGGAFGSKAHSRVQAVARELADHHGRAVRVLYAREDCTRLGPKRPPVAAGIRTDGSGVLRVASTPGVAHAVRSVAPGLEVEEVEVDGPPTTLDTRAAGWAEALVLQAAVTDPGVVSSPDGSRAEAHVSAGGLGVRVACGDPLDEVVLRSYCIGAAHMALGWVTSEAVTVPGDGEVQDLTIRSFGILTAAEMPHVDVEIEPSDEDPVNGSDAVFTAVASAVWASLDFPTDWPTHRVPWP